MIKCNNLIAISLSAMILYLSIEEIKYSENNASIYHLKDSAMNITYGQILIQSISVSTGNTMTQY
jgi:hypothetical protein